jgi:S1-C subfamily serine protease
MCGVSLTTQDGGMLNQFSNQMADAVASAAPSVVQVNGGRRPVSGLVYATDVVLTTMRGVGQHEHVAVRRDDGQVVQGDLAGWDPATQLAVLRVPGLGSSPIVRATEEPRVGHLALAIARSWSNAVTATAGLVSVIGGPLATGRRRTIDRVIRTSAPMHEGFSGGAFLNTEGRLLGVATAISIRGLGVVIPADTAWAAAATLLEHGSLKRGYLGIVGQPVGVPVKQRGDSSQAEGLVIVSVKPGSPADAAGLLVGDILLALDGHPLASPEDLLDLLVGDRVSRASTLQVIRGQQAVSVSVTIAERPATS